ncbi:MAG: hypothetical protein FP816_15875 [Desulfobacteraceae bacterium]|nr:hypothetical protein [Desulfobacteraceae bacterium]MBU4055861.1 hypothetical protein [Pseudomonadota bacterium]
MLRKCLLFMFVITMGALFMACGDKYGEAVDVNKQFAAAMEEYVMALDKAENAQAVANAMDDYTAKMEKIVPKMKSIADKYPELKTTTEVPEELRVSREKAEAAGGKMAGAMMKMVQYMTDPKVLEAQQRMQKAMTALTTE